MFSKGFEELQLNGLFCLYRALELSRGNCFPGKRRVKINIKFLSIIQTNKQFYSKTLLHLIQRSFISMQLFEII